MRTIDDDSVASIADSVASIASKPKNRAFSQDGAQM
jgi:hypothetical protein